MVERLAEHTVEVPGAAFLPASGELVLNEAVAEYRLNHERPLRAKSFAFALRIVKLSQYLIGKQEYIMSKQVLRAGTAIGALVREAEYAESKADFIHKLAIALKEANETEYWLELLHQSGFIDAKGFASIHTDNQELLKLLIAIIKSLKAGNR
ncbi:MAG TPA: four helix bundle protein [Candidatus Obscuribacterales bacterium]